MSTIRLGQFRPRPPAASPSIVLVGNPNAGKTSLFNALTGLRAKTANFPGITVEHRGARIRLRDEPVDLVDLPGLYSLDAITPEERLAESALRGEVDATRPALVLLVIDATNLERNLFLAGQVLEMGLPTVVALNLVDAARAAGIRFDAERLAAALKCPVVPVSARTGEGLDALRDTLADTLSVAADAAAPPPAHRGCACSAGCGTCPFSGRYEWAEQVAREAGVHQVETHGRTTTAIDRVLTHPILGVLSFLVVMAGVFYLIFRLATIPMDLIESGFGIAGSAMSAVLPAGDLQSLIVDGLIGGVGGVLVFLPQICILFFLVTLLEDSGYLARAAFVMERLMRLVGLPGKAFVPMLSAHACAIPGIMATRVIEDRRDRLVTILVLPLLTCSARLPVYAMVAALLFADEPAMGAIVFLGAYTLGIVAALLTALCLKRTVLKGDAAPLVLELPAYRLPSLRSAFMTTIDRAGVFIRKAGTTILVISIVLWALATYPKMPPGAMTPTVAQRVQDLESRAAALDDVHAAAILAEVDHLVSREQLSYSIAGRLGRFVEPVFAPLGFDWRINVGVLSSFAAREVIVSTLGIIYGIGDEAADDEYSLAGALRAERRADGTPVFTMATSLSLLVFYVLAMQCLPTQVVTRRETGSWGWALFQLAFMTVLAYVGALVTFQVATALGG
ncbi:MAG: ferrous iron transporter B [Phycisphaerales bacterium]|nr:ferrous iron transporter B [Phycisphaerales bacterium]